jgi:hypothetical protein
MIFLAEYIMATGDDSVLPGLRRIALESANGQSIVGSWGHKFAGEDGRLVGYGMMNAAGLPLTIGLDLARRAGVDDEEVRVAIERSAKFLRFYINKGAITYGDMSPWIGSPMQPMARMAWPRCSSTNSVKKKVPNSSRA